MSRLRPLVLGLGLGSETNSAIFRKLVNSSLLEALERGDASASTAIVRDILPAALHDQAAALVSGALSDASA
jgi:precorrin-2 dehydrogenase/sirohydrochlorin ferrochelatase